MGKYWWRGPAAGGPWFTGADFLFVSREFPSNRPLFLRSPLGQTTFIPASLRLAAEDTRELAGLLTLQSKRTYYSSSKLPQNLLSKTRRHNCRKIIMKWMVGWFCIWSHIQYSDIVWAVNGSKPFFWHASALWHFLWQWLLKHGQIIFRPTGFKMKVMFGECKLNKFSYVLWCGSDMIVRI